MATITDTNPWKGLNFYVEGEVLYGRDHEIESLSQCIFYSTQTVLYGKSGIGKSSILNAGIFPLARRSGLLPVGIRLDHSPAADSYVNQIRHAVESQAGVEAHQILPAVNPDYESLWEYMHRHVFFGEYGKRLQLLLVFDQFEEIFTLQKDEKLKRAFFEELAGLLNDVTPLYIVNANRQQTDNTPHEQPQMVTGELGDLDLDLNLEEDTAEATPSYLHKVDYHLVFTLREDFLSYLERYTAYIPAMKSNRYPLLPLCEEQAADIIMKPRPGLVSKEVATLIIQKVTGKSDFQLNGIPEIDVDAAVLSLYLSRLYEKKGNSNTISADLVYQFSDDIIKDFYEESVADLPASDIEKIEDQLLTYDGRRNNVSRSDLIREGVSAQTVGLLVEDRKLLRQFSYQDDLRVEFMHDILCPVVDARINQRETTLQQEKERLHQEEALLRSKRRFRRLLTASAALFVLFVAAVVLLWPRLPEKYYQLNLKFEPNADLASNESWRASFRLVAHEKDSLVQLPVQTLKGTPVDTLVISDWQNNEFVLSVSESFIQQVPNLRVELYNVSKNCKDSTYVISLADWLNRRQHVITLDGIKKLLLKGQVVAADNTPIREAIVIFGAQPMQKTDSHGDFTFYLNDSAEIAGQNLYVFKEDYEAEHIQGSLLLASGRGLDGTPLVLPLTSIKMSADTAKAEAKNLFLEQRNAFLSLFKMADKKLRERELSAMTQADSANLDSALKVYPHFALQRANLRRIDTKMGDSELFGVTLYNPQVDGIRDAVGNYYADRRDHLYQGKFIRSGNGPYWFLQATGHDIDNTSFSISVKMEEIRDKNEITGYELIDFKKD